MRKADHSLQLYKLDFEASSASSLTASDGGMVSGSVSVAVRPVGDYSAFEKDLAPKYFYCAEDVDRLLRAKMETRSDALPIPDFLRNQENLQAERTVWTKNSDSDPYCVHCGKTWDMHICDGRSSCPTART